MQIALPIEVPLDKSILSIGALLLAGITVFPITQDHIISSEGIRRNEVVNLNPKEIDKRDYVSTINRPEHTLEFESSDLKNEVLMLKRFDQNHKADRIKHIEKVVQSALSWLGVSYRWGGTTRNGVDCSALVQNVYRINGVDLPRTSQEQFRCGVGVPRSQLKPGDLVFFSTSGPGASHVGIYIGDQEFVSATRSRVEIQSMAQPYWNHTYRGSRRIIN